MFLGETAAVLRGIGALVLACGVFLLGACGDQGDGDAVDPATPLRLGLAGQPTSGLVHLAVARDRFAATGVAVEVVPYASGKLALKAMLAGEVDLCTTAEVPVVKALLDGAELRILAQTCGADSVQRIVARKSAGITAPADLAGKRVATQEHSAVHYFLARYLDHHGIAAGDVVQSFMKGSKLPKALAEKRIDAFSMREPFVGQARELLGDDCVVLGDRGVYLSLDLVVAAPETVTRRGGACRRFLTALLAAERELYRDEAAARAAICASLGAAPGALDADWPRYAYRLDLSQALCPALERQAAWFQRGATTAPAALAVLDVLAPSPLEAVAPERVTVIR